MNCLGCGFDNPATVAYCQKCGGKLNLTADEIQASLVERAKAETAGNTEFYARNALVGMIVFFLFAFTVLWMSGGAREGTYYIPSASNGADYVKVEYQFKPEIRPLGVSLEK